MIRTQDLSKFYNGFKAVQGLNLHVRAGEIYGFLGPNGAGKTTTLSMLLGITRPTHGTVWLFDKQLRDDYFAIKRRIGVVSERQFLYDDVSGQEYLEFFAALYRVPDAARRIDELLEAVHLAPFRDVLARAYSNGMKQKLGLARALLHDPDVLILDEPVSGLDPHGIMQVRNIILDQRKRGKAILGRIEKIDQLDRPVLEPKRMGLHINGWRGSNKVLEIKGLAKAFTPTLPARVSAGASSRPTARTRSVSKNS